MSAEIFSLPTKRKKVLSFGELLLRISPDSEGQWLKENKLPFYVGGAEANVAAALALWGVPSAYLSAVPDHAVAHEIVNELVFKGIDTSHITFRNGRLGLYYLTAGQDVKNAGVIYDRANSAFAQLETGEINWDQIFEDVSWFHFSAICPAINQALADVCLEALKVASEKNILISLDLNYRSKLWKYGKSPIEVLPELANYCTLIMGNPWAAYQMLGIPLHPDTEADNPTKETLLRQATQTSIGIFKAFPTCKVVANTFRFDYGNGIRYYSAMNTHDKSFVSAEYQSDQILDKVGSGDCFMAGLIYGFYNRIPVQQILDFATAAAYDKFYIQGDATTSSVIEIENRLI